MAKKNKVRVNVGGDKISAQSRVDRSETTTTVAPTSPTYQNNPVVKATCDNLTAAGAKLKSAAAMVHAREVALAEAKSLQEEALDGWDASYKAFVSAAEERATSPQEIQSLGLEVLTRGSYSIAPPVSIEARYDVPSKQIRIRVEQAPGNPICLTEYSTDAAEPRVYKRIKGGGTRPVIANVTPGTYWVRAASLRANDESEFTAPVAVTVA